MDKIEVIEKIAALISKNPLPGFTGPFFSNAILVIGGIVALYALYHFLKNRKSP